MSRPRPVSPYPRLAHPWLYAIPSGALPPTVTCAGHSYVLVETFKHDFFAATGLYRAGDDLAVLKVNRTGDCFGVPLRWAGAWLARREIHNYRVTQGLPGVPAYLGAVGPTGFMHAFVPGRPLGRYERVGDSFFADLEALLRAMHARHLAYVDLNKRQNILLGADGRPHLVDLQISLHLPPAGWGATRFGRWLLGRFQHADLYHCLKHKRRLRPDLLTSAEEQVVTRLSPWIRLHRGIARPLTQLRRRILRQLQTGDEGRVAGSGAK